MAEYPNVLVVAAVVEEEWRADTPHFYFCQELCDQLAREPSIRLASRTPMDVSAAAEIAAESPQPLIFVVVAGNDLLAEATALLRPQSGDVPPIPVAFDEGTASLELHRVGRAQIVDLVLTAVRSIGPANGRPDEDRQSGEVIDIGFRLPGEDRHEPQAERRRPQLPVTAADGKVDVNVRRTLQTVMGWVDAATGVLVELWSNGSGEESAVYGLSWDALMASLDRLLGIRDAPMEKAQEQYRYVQAMLAHPSARHTPMVRLSRLLERDDLAMKLLMIALAPELDIRFQRLFGALHDDMGRRHVSMGLACAIVAAATAKATPRHVRSDISALAILRDFRLIEGIGDTMPAADELLRIDPRLLDWLITGETSWLIADPAPDAILRPSPLDALGLLPADRHQEIESALNHGIKRHGDPSQFDAIVVTGSEPGWIEVEACALTEAELRIAPPATEIAGDSLDRILREAIRASRLLDRRLVVDMLDPGPQGEAFWRALAPLLPLCAPQPYVISDNPAWLLSLTAEEAIAVAPLPPVRQGHRVAAIAAAIAPGTVPEAGLAQDIAERFRVPLTALPDIAPLARAEAAKAHLGIPGDAEWRAAFRSVAGSHLPHLARRVPPRARPREGSQLDRVVLPAGQRRQLETIVSHVRVGGKVLRDWQFGDLLDARGVSALFTGESGTGKTTAAHAIASELDTDLYVIDLARIVSKYIGETEKNLDVVFTEAQRAGAVLLFDEADALFGKRSAVNDAHDRYANIEVAYLLQRVELFDGLAILTTNHARNIDPAFGRRLRFTVEFPFPAAADRQRIWEQAIPKESPHRGDDLDFALAARRLEVNGGSIRQIVIHALMAAAAGSADGIVRGEHLREATRTELARLGKYDKLGQVDGLFCPPFETRAA